MRPLTNPFPFPVVVGGTTGLCPARVAGGDRRPHGREGIFYSSGVGVRIFEQEGLRDETDPQVLEKRRQRCVTHNSSMTQVGYVRVPDA